MSAMVAGVNDVVIPEDLSTLTDEQIDALAHDLQIPKEALKIPEFPSFIDGKGYHLRIIAAENKKSGFGSDQVELTLVALDIDGQPVNRARGKMWISYPFESASFKFRDVDARERSTRDCIALLRASGNPIFFDYITQRRDENRTIYLDERGEPLIGKAYQARKQRARKLAMIELDRRRREGPDAWVGTEFYAQSRHTEKDGNVYRNWVNITPQMKDGVEYILDGAHMLARHGEELADAASADIPF